MQQQSGCSSEKTDAGKFVPAVGRKSWVWKHFVFPKADGQAKNSHVICKLCKFQLKYSGNTTNLSAHLKRKHGIEESILADEKESLSPPMMNFFAQTLPHNSKRAASITSSITFFICKDMRPYSVVENEGFRHLLHTLEPKYSIPSRQHFSESCIPKLYRQVKDNIQHTLTDAERVAITTDGWTSCTTEAYVTVTCHYIDTDWQMKNYVLQTRVLNDSHTGVNLGKVLREACEEWNILDKKPALVTDNASNMAIAGEKANLSPQIKCFAHTINLATQKGLKCAGAARLLGRVRRIVSFFHRSTTGTTVLKEKQRLLRVPEHKLKQDVITRWNSSFDMLERFLEQQAAVCASLLDKKLRKLGNDVHTLDENDITIAEDMVKLLAPVKTATTIMCEEVQPTVSVIAPLQAKLLNHFTVTAEDSSVITEMKQAMAKDLEHRYVDVRQILYRASALDPRFKKLPFLSEEERDATFQYLAHEAAELMIQKNDTVSQFENATAHSSADKTSDDDPDLMPVFQAETTEEYVPSSKKSKTFEDLFGDTFCTVDPSQTVKTPKELAHAEVVKYRETASLNLGGKVLEWWKSHETEFPLLANLAKTYMCIPGTSVPSERVFSTAGDIVHSERSVLSPEHVDQLIFLKKNLSKDTTAALV